MLHIRTHFVCTRLVYLHSLCTSCTYIAKRDQLNLSLKHDIKIICIILYPINSSNRHSSYVPRDRPIYSGIGSKKSVFFPYWTVEYKCTKQLFYNDKSRYREKVSECTIIDSHGRLS